MPDEEKVSQETESTVTEKSVTDDDLANAMTGQETGKEVSEEKKVTAKEKTPEEVEEHKERSNLGRKLKKLEDDFAKQTELLQNLQGVLTNQNRSTTFQNDEMPEYISTPQDLERYETVKARKQQQQKQLYEGEYVKAVRGMSGQDEDDGEEVLAEVLNVNSPFNRYITGNPVVDARLNYAEAAKAVLKKKTAAEKGKPNVKGGKSPVSPQLNVTSREESSRSEEPELDEFSKDFIRMTKMNDESKKAALGIK